MILNLSQKQRIVTAALYFSALVALFRFINGAVTLPVESSPDSEILFISGALMIVLGAYVVEPLFTKPSDAIANSVAVIISLLGLTSKNTFIGYHLIMRCAILVLCLGIISIFLKDSVNLWSKKFAKLAYWFTITLGKSKVIFSLLYLAASYSFYATPGKTIQFISVVAFWICITFFDIFGLFIQNISKLRKFLHSMPGEELGQAIGCDNPLLYRIEIDYTRHKSQPVEYGNIVAIETSPNVGSVGMVINTKFLLNKKWLSIYLLQNNKREIIKIDLKTRKLVTDAKSIFSNTNAVYRLIEKELPQELIDQILGSGLYHNKNEFIGYVSHDSNISAIHFTILRDPLESRIKISEGTILKTLIYEEETLYQVIDGRTKAERLENFDTYGYTIGIARKLGIYRKDIKELNINKWLPDIYSPLFIAFSKTISEDTISQIAKNAIGRLPNTDFEIPLKDINAIVTHNTAILGILGIGKSCLAFELIKKILDKGIKIFCIDITNQYYSENGMFKYIERSKISFDLPEDQKKALKESKDDPKRVKDGNPQASGNIKDYIQVLGEDVKSFLENEKLCLKIYNPDLHPVSKGVAFKATTLDDLTIAEKTRVICERIFTYAMHKGQSDQARYLIVFEEAHSLVPEWNSVANEGDKNATNGTAKVILQGRKYGLGSLVITQRTANVSKSILNQCNTIFALRVFDDTGKSFLENYIGEDYANTLPTLEERHVIAIGRGLKLKQPAILQLNDMKLIIENVPPIQENNSGSTRP